LLLDHQFQNQAKAPETVKAINKNIIENIDIHLELILFFISVIIV
jgi:hypothetical protein